MRHLAFKALPFLLYALISLAINNNSLYSQYAAAAAPFLNIPPSGISQAIGNCSVAIAVQDVFSVRDNPAHLGILSSENNLLISSYPSAMKLYSIADNNVGYINHGFAVGYNFGRDSGSIPLSIGAAYIYQDVDLGEYVKTLEDGTKLGTYHSNESANNFSIGASLDLGVKLGIGLTYKNIESNITPIIIPDSGVTSFEGTAGAFDIGIFASFPIVESMIICEGLSFDIDAALGMSVSNLGSELDYRDESEPLPRRSNIGYSVSAGLNYKLNNSIVKLFKIDWTCEAEDLLVKRDSLGFDYEPAFSDVNFVQNFLLLSSPNKESVRFGVSVSVLEMFRIIYGSFSYGDEWGSAHGFGIQLKGMLKLYSGLDNDSFAKYLAEHIDLGFNFAKTNYPSMSSSDKESFSIVLSMRNIF